MNDASSNSKLEVKREDRLYGSVLTLCVRLDEVKLGDLANGEEKQFDLSLGRHILQVVGWHEQPQSENIRFEAKRNSVCQFSCYFDYRKVNRDSVPYISLKFEGYQGLAALKNSEVERESIFRRIMSPFKSNAVLQSFPTLDGKSLKSELAGKARLLPQEILMCGLRSLPFIGRTLEVYEAVSARYDAMVQEQRLQRMEQKLSPIDLRIRDVVQEEMRSILKAISNPRISGSELNEQVKNLNAIRSYDFQPALFEGLLKGSQHWNDLRTNPSNYGKLLMDKDSMDSSKIHLFLDLDKTRILELSPFAVSGLLASRHEDRLEAKLIAPRDVWALTT